MANSKQSDWSGISFENRPYAKTWIVNHFNKNKNPTRKIKETADKSDSTMSHIRKSISLLNGFQLNGFQKILKNLKTIFQEIFEKFLKFENKPRWRWRQNNQILVSRELSSHMSPNLHSIDKIPIRLHQQLLKYILLVYQRFKFPGYELGRFLENSSRQFFKWMSFPEIGLPR